MTFTNHTVNKLEQLSFLAIPVKLLLLDVDGVLTDGSLYFGNNGEELKAFNIHDGLGIKLLQRNGVKVGIVTGRRSQLVANRARDLGIEIVVQGREDKWVAIQEIMKEHTLSVTEIAYMGDDLPDASALSRVGFGMTVANASSFIKQQAKWTSQHEGGCGAVREAAEFILQAQGKLHAILDDYQNR